MQYNVIKFKSLADPITERFLTTMERFGVYVIEEESESDMRTFRIDAKCGSVWRNAVAYAVLTVANEKIDKSDNNIIAYEDIDDSGILGFKILKEDKDVSSMVPKIIREVMGDLSKYRSTKVVKIGVEMRAFDDDEIFRFILGKISKGKPDDRKSIKKLRIKYGAEQPLR